MPRHANKFCAISLMILLVSFVAVAAPTSWRNTGTAGTSSLGDNDFINLFNGRLNFTLPLFKVNGRGDADFTVPLSIQNTIWRKYTYFQPHYYEWGSEPDQKICTTQYTYTSVTIDGETTGGLEPHNTETCYNSGGSSGGKTFLDFYQYPMAYLDDLRSKNPGYGPGRLYSEYDVRSQQDWSGAAPLPSHIPNYGYGRGHLEFVLPDGSTQMFVDTKSMGSYHSYDLVNGIPTIFELGANFTTIDGSGTIYISDSSTDHLKGYIINKDGTRHRVETGLIRWTQDVNGNRTVFSYVDISDPYFGNQTFVSKITDSLGREITFNYDINDGATAPDGTPYGVRDEITYKSFGGADKKIIISKAPLENVLRSGLSMNQIYQAWNYLHSVRTPYPVFPGVPEKKVISAVWTSDGKATKFKYDSFGNLSRIEYPTGAAVEYDYVKGNGFEFLRRVSEKRVYGSANDPNSLINKTTFSDIYPQTAFLSTPAATIPVQVDVRDSANNLLTRSKHYFKGDPLNQVTQTDEVLKLNGIEDALSGKEIKTEFLNPVDQSVFKKIEYNWQVRVNGYNPPPCITVNPCAPNGQSLLESPARDPILVETKTTLYENGTALVSKTSAINPSTGAFAFDENNNPTDSWIYDYGIGNPGRLLKHSKTNFLKVNPSNGVNYANPNSGTDYTISDPYMAGLPTGNLLFDVSPNGSETLISQSENRYDESAYPVINAGTTTNWVDPNTPVRGNVTTSRIWSGTTGNWTETHTQFDNLGNARKAWDAKGSLSETEFSPTYNYAYPTKAISVVPDPTGQRGSNVPFETVTTYDFYTGLLLSTTDANGQTSLMEYNDPLLRPTRVVPPAGGAQIITEYGDTVGNLFVRTKTQIDSTNWAESTAYFDGLGNTFRTQKKDSQGDVFTETIYDSLGRVKQVTNPFRNGETKQWSTTNYDAVGRVKEIISPDGTKVESDYGVSTVPDFVGTVIVGTDPSGRQGRSITDSLGQLVRVDEPDDNGNLGSIANPVQPTFYNYSPQGKMVKVQQGIQNRYFLYDGLGRLIRIRQPEQEANPNLNLSDPITGNSQWTIGFTYDVTGNLLTATDAKNVTVTNTYDNANRLLTRAYSDGTSPANYYYDNPGIQFSKGKLTKSENAISTSQIVAFDNLGRTLASQQITDGNTFTSSYVYNLGGTLLEETYPSGRKVKNTVESDGNLSKIETQKLNQNWELRAQNFTYNSSGAIRQLQIGNGLWENAQFNNRFQVTQLGLGTSPTDTSIWKLDYEFGELDANGNLNPAKNNGNIARQTITNPTGVFTQSFRYDSLERLKEARETSGGNQTWIQNFSYDRYGNRTGFAQTINGQSSNGTPAVDVATNRFTTGQGYVYDFAGNIIQDEQGRSFVFNGDNKQVEVKNSQNQIIGQYFYDANGKRIKKVANGESTVFVYSSDKLVAEYTTAATASAAPSTQYLGSDMLGSPRVITNQNAQIVSFRDFMPFGADLPRPNYGADNLRQKFTGYEKDDETGLDFAEARYYNTAHGRFTAVDPLLASGKTANPQTFNRYVYTGNNPVTRVDPDGTDWYVTWKKESVNGHRVWVQIPKWYDTKPRGGHAEWKEGIYRDNQGTFTVLDAWGNRAAFTNTMEQALSYKQRFKDEATANFIIGVLEASSMAFEFSGLGDNFKVDRESGPYKAGKNYGSVTSTVSALLGVGATEFALKGIGKISSKIKNAFKVSCCFVAGTPIHSEDGLVAIENIKVGDKVLSYDEKTKKLEYKRVASVFTSIKTNIVKIKIKGEKTVFTTTTEHPFYIRKNQAGNPLSSSDEDGDWKTAEELKIGDKVLSRNGKWTPIIEISRNNKPTKVYNFEVEENHSYFVGEKGFLSHNCTLPNTIGEQIARGHSFLKHFIQKGDVSMAGTGIRTLKQWANKIDDIIKNATGSNVRQLVGGRTAYWDDELQIVVIHHPTARDGGTAFRPDKGRQYFDDLR